MEKDRDSGVAILTDSIYTPKKPKLVKRIAAWIVDFILFLVLATGFAFFLSFATNYDHYVNVVNDKAIAYNVAEKDEETGKVVYYDENTPGIQDKLQQLYKDQEFVKAYQMRRNCIFIIVLGGETLSLVILEFVLPLVLKHGRTIGMRFFDVGYVTDDGIDPPFKNIFVRFLFGRLLLTAIIPTICVILVLYGYLGASYALISIIFLAIEILLNIYMLCIGPEKRGLHDYIARMKPVDNSCQIYCKTTQELAANQAAEMRRR